MRGFLTGLAAIGLLGGCATLDDFGDASREQAAIDRYARDAFSAVERTSVLSSDRFECSGSVCEWWEGSEIVASWKLSSADRCLGTPPLRELAAGEICLDLKLSPRIARGVYRHGLSLKVIGARPADGAPFSPDKFAIDGLDQELVIEH